MKSSIDFLDSPLTIWAKSVELNNDKLDYEQFTNGNYLYLLLKQIDSRLQNIYLPNDLLKTNEYDFNSILLNLDFILRTIRAHYQFNLNQILVYKLPDIYQIAKYSNTENEDTLKELEIFLILILGCAINGDYKEIFIENIQKLDTQIQVQLVPYIQLVTEDINFSISKLETDAKLACTKQQQQQQQQYQTPQSLNSSISSTSSLIQSCQTLLQNQPNNSINNQNFSKLLFNIQRLVDERDSYVESIIELKQDKDFLQMQIYSRDLGTCCSTNHHHNDHKNHLIIDNNTNNNQNNDNHHHQNNLINLNVNDTNLIINKQQKVSMELVECKVKMRQLRIEIEEKSEQIECLREELSGIRNEITKLRNENIELNQKAALVAIYSDEVELLREKSLKCEKYECEMLKYKEKLEEFDMIKVRCEELKDENSVLLETRTFLERQIDQYQIKLSNTNRNENDLLKYKQELNDLQEQFGQDQARICELLETQTRLELEVKNLINENHSLNEELVYYKNKATTVSTTIVQQQTQNSSSAKVLQLELEFKKLDTELSNVKQNESKLQNELYQKNREIESLKKDIQTLKQNESNENSKIKELSLQLIKLQFDEKQLRKQKSLEDEEELNRLRSEIDSLKHKLNEIDEEKCLLTQRFDNLSNENYSKQLKIIELEQDIKKLNKLNDLLKEDLNKAYSEKETFENKCRLLDKEVIKQKQQIEAKNMSLDECMKKIKTLAEECQQEQKLKKQVLTLEKQIEEFRKKNLDLKQEEEEIRKIEVDKYQKLNRDFMEIVTKNEQAENKIQQLQIEIENFKNNLKIIENENLKLKDELLNKKDSLQLNINQLNDKCQAYEITIEKLEDEKTQLFDQLHILLQQNQELLTQALNSKDVYHEHTKAYMEKLNNLHRQKEILEQKIMEQYKNGSLSKKKKGGLMDLVSKKTHQLVQRVRTKSSSSSSAASNSNPLNKIIDNSISSIQSSGSTSHYDELAIPLNQSLDFCEGEQNSFDQQVTAIEIGNHYHTSSPYSHIQSNRSTYLKSPASFLNENRLNALSKELAASAHALNEIGTNNSNTKKYCSNENLLDSVGSLSSVGERRSPLKINEIEIIEKANSDTQFNPTTNTQNQFYLTPRQTKTDHKLIKLTRAATNNTSSSSPTSVTSQFLSSPTTSTSTPLNKLTSEAYKNATLAYRSDNFSQQLKHLSSTSNSLSSSSSSSTNTINTHPRVLANSRSSCVRRLNSPNDKQSFDTGYYEEVEIPIQTTTTTTATKNQQRLISNLQQSSPAANSTSKSNEIWLEYGCI